MQSILISLICCCFHSGRITFKAKVIPETIKTCYSIFFSYFFCSSFSVSTDLVSWWYQCSHWWSHCIVPGPVLAHRCTIFLCHLDLEMYQYISIYQYLYFYIYIQISISERSSGWVTNYVHSHYAHVHHVHVNHVYVHHLTNSPYHNLTITISPSPSLYHHLSITISLSPSLRHHIAVTISLYHHLAFSLSPSQSRLHHLADTILLSKTCCHHISDLWPPRQYGRPECRLVWTGEENQSWRRKNTKPRVRSAPDGSDKNLKWIILLLICIFIFSWLVLKCNALIIEMYWRYNLGIRISCQFLGEIACSECCALSFSPIQSIYWKTSRNSLLAISNASISSWNMKVYFFS